MQGVLACCNPIPPLVRQSLHAIHRIVKEAREVPLTKVRKKCKVCGLFFATKLQPKDC